MRCTEQFLTNQMPGTRILYSLALGGYLGTLALLTAWYGWLAPSSYFPAAYVLLFLLTPLLFALRGMLHGRPYTFQWSCFLALFYFMHGIGEAWASDTTRYLGLLEVLLTSTWFLAAIIYVRRGK